MQVPQPSFRRPTRILGLREAILLAWAFLHLLLMVEPHLVCQWRGPLVSFAPGFLDHCLAVSGGLTDCLSQYLATLYARDWMGALILVVEVALVGGLAHACFRAIAGRPVGAVRYVAAGLFFLICCQYDQLPAMGPSLILMLVWVLLFARLPLRSRPLRLGAFLLLSAALYYGVAGAWGKLGLLLTFVAFVPLCLSVEARRPAPTDPGKAKAGAGRARAAVAAWSLAALLGSAGIAYFGEKYLLRSDAGEWLGALEGPWMLARVLAILLYAFLPLAAAAVALELPARLGRLAGPLLRRLSAGGSDGPDTPEAAARARRDRRLLWLLQTVALLGVASWLATSVCARPAMRRTCQLEYDLAHGRWQDLLGVARSMPIDDYNLLVNADVNLALFHTGRLASDLFSFPQTGRMIVPFQQPRSFAYLYRLAQQSLELGRVDEAEHAAYENLAMEGENAYTLQQLATIHLVKGQYLAATTYLNLLTWDPLCGEWARRKLRLLENDPGLASDPEIQRLRSVMLTEDDVQDVTLPSERDPVETWTYDDEKRLLNVLKRNPKNRMAFDYLMCSWVMEGRLDLVVANINGLDAFHEKQLPRVYEEAMAVYEVESGRTPDLHGRRVSQGALERYRQYKEDLARAGSDRAQAYQALVGRYGDTAYFFRTFGGGAAQ